MNSASVNSKYYVNGDNMYVINDLIADLHNDRMSFHDGLIAFLTIVVSLILVIVIVGAAWWLMWKV